MRAVTSEYKEAMQSAIRDRGYAKVTIKVGDTWLRANSTCTLIGSAKYRIAFKNPLRISKVSVTFGDNIALDGSISIFKRISDTEFQEESFSWIAPLGVQAPKTQVVEFEETEVREFTVTADLLSNPYADFILESYSVSSSETSQYDNLEFNSDKIENIEFTDRISPISKEIAQRDATIKLMTKDDSFAVGNPNGYEKLLTSGTDVTIQFGFQMEDENTWWSGEYQIYWLDEVKLKLSDWNVGNDGEITLNCVDALQLSSKTVTQFPGMTYKDAFENECLELGLTASEADISEDYVYWGYCPKVDGKELLQQIANATGKYLKLTDEGGAELKTAYTKANSATATKTATEYANKVESAITGNDAIEYADFSTNYITMDGTMHFKPKSADVALKNTGYVSQQSATNGTIDASYECNFNEVVNLRAVWIRLGSIYPIDTVVTINYKDEQGNSQSHSETIRLYHDYKYDVSFNNVSSVKLDFSKTSESNSRIIIKCIEFITVNTAIEFTDLDRMSLPVATKADKVKQIKVGYSTLKTGELSPMVTEMMDVAPYKRTSYEFASAYTDYEVTCSNDSTVSMTIVQSDDYTVAFHSNKRGNYEISISAKQKELLTSYYPIDVQYLGEEITWDNPLINSVERASAVAQILGNYYADTLEYEYDTRGNPELEAGDMIDQFDIYQGKIPVMITEITTSFNGTFSGHVKTRRV